MFGENYGNQINHINNEGIIAWPFAIKIFKINLLKLDRISIFIEI